MRLHLQEADPCRQLRDDAHVLVVRGEDAPESGAVRADLGDVVIGSGAVLGAAVTTDSGVQWGFPVDFGIDCCGEVEGGGDD